MTLNLKHKKYKPLADLRQMLKDYPEMKRFLMDGSGIVFSSAKINKYLGYEFCNNGVLVTSEIINFILDRLEIEGFIENE